MNQPFFKKILPHIIALISFILIAMLYFSPLIEGKKLDQHDVKTFIGQSKEIMDFREATGEEALWTNSMFGGMPAYQISVKQNGNLIKKAEYFFKAIVPHPASMIIISMIGFYFLLITLGTNAWLSLAGALAYALSSYMFIILGAGHNTKALAMSYMPFVLSGIILTFRKRYLLGGVLTAIFTALELSANHLQITYYFIIIALAYGISQFIFEYKQKQLDGFFKAVAVLLIAVILGVLPNITNLWTSMEYVKDSTRGKSELSLNEYNQTTGLDKDYATGWSYGIGETWSVLIPNVKGGVSEPMANNPEALKDLDPSMSNTIGRSFTQYWGDQPFVSGPVYFGAIIIFLFILALFVTKGPLKWALITATILSILLAWGKNFMPLTSFFLDYVPGYNKFRAVSMTLVIAGFTVPLLAFMGIRDIIKKPSLLTTKILLIAFVLTGGVSFIFYLVPQVFFNFFSQNELSQFAQMQMNTQIEQVLQTLEEVRIGIFKADAIRSFFFILLAAVLVYLWQIKKIKTQLFGILLAFLILIDMGIIDKRYINNDDFTSKRKAENPYTAGKADNEILLDKDEFRVLTLNNPFNDASVSYFHNSIGGYHAAKMKKYQELIEFYLQNEIKTFIDVLQKQANITSINNALKSMGALNMLNTRYIIYNKDASPIKNPYALGNAWIVNEYEIVADANEEMAALKNLPVQTKLVCVEKFSDDLKRIPQQQTVNGNIELIEYQPNHLTYKANTDKAAAVVFSEIFYNKGWKAYIDGKESSYFRANYLLRAMVIPEGEHTIEFVFEPNSYYVGKNLAIGGSIFLILALILALYYEWKKTKKEDKIQIANESNESIH